MIIADSETTELSKNHNRWWRIKRQAGATSLLCRYTAETLPRFAALAFLQNLGERTGAFVVLTFVGWLSAGLSFATVVILGSLISNLAQLGPDDVLQFYVPLWAGCLFLGEILGYFTRRCGESLAQKVADSTEVRIVQSILATSLARLRSISLVGVRTTIQTYCRHVEQVGDEWCWTLKLRSFNAVAIVVVLWLQSPFVLLFNCVMFGLYLALALRISSRIAPYAARQLTERLALTERQTSSVLSLPFLRRAGREEFYAQWISDTIVDSWQALDALKRFHAWRWFIQLSVFDVMLVGTIGYGAYQVALGELEIGFLVLLHWSFEQLWQIQVYILEWYVRFIHEREDAELLAGQLRQLQNDNMAEHGDAHHLLDWHTITLNQCSVSYPDRAPLALPDLIIHRGEWIAIQGESGAGKTSLLEVIGRFSPFQGVYLIDGEEERNSAAGRIQVTMITPHDPILKASIRDNILLGLSRSDADIERALDVVMARSFIPSLDAILGTVELALSTGQEQRLRLARALLSEAPLLLLDEPLTGLDDETRHLILGNLRNALHGKTIVWVTHHADEVEVCSRCYRL